VFKLDSEAALLAAFRPKDRPRVEVAPDLSFPLAVHDYLAWRHPAGGRVFLVFAVPGGAPTGIAFDAAEGPGPSVPHLCQWCHSSVEGNGVGLLTATLNGTKRIGVHVCSDLSCGQKLEEAANRLGQSVRPMMVKLVARMGQFASEGLKMDLSGQRR
jgi:hypothetical protein